MGLVNGKGGGGCEGRDASEVRGEEACLLGGGKWKERMAYSWGRRQLPRRVVACSF